MVKPGSPYCRGRLGTVDLLVLTSLDLLIYILTGLFAFVAKQRSLIRRSTVLSLSLQLVFPGQTLQIILSHWQEKLTFPIFLCCVVS
jgi:hypothetical protein